MHNDTQSAVPPRAMVLESVERGLSHSFVIGPTRIAVLLFVVGLSHGFVIGPICDRSYTHSVVIGLTIGPTIINNLQVQNSNDQTTGALQFTNVLIACFKREHPAWCGAAPSPVAS